MACFQKKIHSQNAGGAGVFLKICHPSRTIRCERKEIINYPHKKKKETNKHFDETGKRKAQTDIPAGETAFRDFKFASFHLHINKTYLFLVVRAEI
jgi:hypothetical protein